MWLTEYTSISLSLHPETTDAAEGESKPHLLQLMRSRALLSIFCCALLLTGQRYAQTPSPPEAVDAPSVTGCSPQTASVNSIIELSGFRLGSDRSEPAKVIFIQNGAEVSARTRGSSFTTNNSQNGPQTLKVIVPEELVPGQAQIVLERNGLRSAPINVTITEWRLPIVKGVVPAAGPTDTLVVIECDNLHEDDEVELTDASGRRVTPTKGAGSSDGKAFVVPEDASEGTMTIRIGSSKRNQFTEPFTFNVTNDALSPELRPEWIKSVAAGQWIDLQSSSLVPFKQSELTEVSYKQNGRTILVKAPFPFRPHVEVPAALSPGDVQVQVRTWREGWASEWSTPVELRLLSAPLPPAVYALHREKGNWVDLTPGPDKPSHFVAKPTELIVMNGLFPVASVDKLRVVMARAGQNVELRVTEVDKRADWFSEVKIKLPKRISAGDWQMSIRGVADHTEALIPIALRIATKEN